MFRINIRLLVKTLRVHNVCELLYIYMYIPFAPWIPFFDFYLFGTENVFSRHIFFFLASRNCVFVVFLSPTTLD